MAEPLKNLYSPTVIADLGTMLEKAHSAIDANAFADWVQSGDWHHLELKARIARVADALAHFLPGSFAEQLHVLDVVHPQFTGFVHIAIPEFVARHGLPQPELALPALRNYTSGSSAEFALRPFLVQHPVRTRQAIAAWVNDADPHVRRLASEGTRPRLPWGQGIPALKADPSPNLPILDALKADPSEYVRRSVANHLNDISKDHPALVRTLAEDWWGQHPETNRMLKHALRTLLKKGDAQALALIGHSASQTLQLESVTLSAESLVLGSQLQIHFVVKNTDNQPQMLRLEYALHYVKANGSRSPKVFQVAQTNISLGETSTFMASRPLHDMTTRKHYPGTHAVQPILNGQRLGLYEFDLLES